MAFVCLYSQYSKLPERIIKVFFALWYACCFFHSALDDYSCLLFYSPDQLNLCKWVIYPCGNKNIVAGYSKIVYTNTSRDVFTHSQASAKENILT